MQATLTDGGGSGGSGGSGGGSTLNPQTKALSKGFLAGSATLNQASDFLADRGFAALRVSEDGVIGFAALGGGNLRYKTGSRIDTDGYNLLAGLAYSRNGLAVGAFVEHGEGNYDTYNSFAHAANIHGNGDADYTGGGLLAQFNFAQTASGNAYAKASARAGKVELDYNSDLGRRLQVTRGRHRLSQECGAPAPQW